MCTREPSLSAGAEQACDHAVGDTLRQCSRLAPSNTQTLRELRELWNELKDISAPALAFTRHAGTTRPATHGKSALVGKLPSLHSPPDHFRRTRGYELHGYGELTSARETCAGAPAAADPAPPLSSVERWLDILASKDNLGCHTFPPGAEAVVWSPEASYFKPSHAKQTERRGAREVTEQQKHTGTRMKARPPQTPASSFSPANFSSGSGQSFRTATFTSSRASGRTPESSTPSSKLGARRASRTASGTRSRATVTPPSPRSMASAPRTALALSSTHAWGKARRAARERETAMQTRYAPGKPPRGHEYALHCADHQHVRRSAIREDESESHSEVVTESDTLLFWELWGLFVTMMTCLSAFVLSITG